MTSDRPRGPDRDPRANGRDPFHDRVGRRRRRRGLRAIRPRGARPLVPGSARTCRRHDRRRGSPPGGAGRPADRRRDHRPHRCRARAQVRRPTPATTRCSKPAAQQANFRLDPRREGEMPLEAPAYLGDDAPSEIHGHPVEVGMLDGGSGRRGRAAAAPQAGLDAQRAAGARSSPFRAARPRAPGRKPRVPRRVQAAAARHRSCRDAGVARFVRSARRDRGREPRPVPRLQAAQARPAAPRRPAAAHPDPLHQHDQPRAGAVLPGRRGPRAPDPAAHPLERGRDGAPGEQPVHGHRRPPLDLRELGHALRGRLQPLLPGQGRRRRRGPDLLPGPRGAGHVRADVPRRPADRGGSRPLPARGAARARTELVSARAADARVLGVPDGLDGPRADQRGLPGALQPLPREPRAQGHRQPARLGVPRRRRDGRARVGRRAVAGRARGPRQPDLRRQLQPPAARRPGPRQRQDHPGARGPVPRRRLERASR